MLILFISPSFSSIYNEFINIYQSSFHRNKRISRAVAIQMANRTKRTNSKLRAQRGFFSTTLPGGRGPSMKPPCRILCLISISRVFEEGVFFRRDKTYTGEYLLTDRTVTSAMTTERMVTMIKKTTSQKLQPGSAHKDLKALAPMRIAITEQGGWDR